jgi:hypothetical protein
MQHFTKATKLLSYVTLGTLLVACGGQEQVSGTTEVTPRLLASTTTGQLTAANYTDVLQHIYVGYFGRPADPAGLAYYADQFLKLGVPTTIIGVNQAYGSNPTLKSILDSFGTSAESRELYPGDNKTFVKAIYKNIFSRDGDDAGISYWSNLLDTGAMTRASAAVTMMAGAMSSDIGTIDKKAALAAAYTGQLNTKELADAYSGMAANALVRSMLIGVSDTTDPTGFQTLIDATNQRLLGNNPPASTTYLGQAYRARNGLDVRINSIVISDQGTQYKNYVVTYTQTNNTSVAINEATLKLYFTNDAAMPEYGFFDKVYPGIPITRTYTFTASNGSNPSILEYDTDNFFRTTPLIDSLQWKLPIPSAPSSVGVLGLFETSLFGQQQDAMPYSATLSFNNVIVGVNYTSVGDYKLTAQGSNFTISNLSAADSTGTVIPSFSGLANGQVITANTSVPFSLRVPLTGGRVVNLTYTFTVRETGQTFLVKATGKTN